MKNVLVIAVLVIGLAISGTAYADLISGKVTGVDVIANTVTVSVTDATGAATDIVISVSEVTTYTGVASLTEVVTGDDVNVEASQDATTQVWSASSIEKVAAPAVEEAPTM